MTAAPFPPTDPPRRVRCDVAVLGGGFGGSLAACCILASGRSVAVIDRGAHPRFAVGESSTPAAGAALRAIGRRFGLDWLPPLTRHGTASGGPVRVGRKRGFSYFRHEPGEAFDPGEDHANELFVLANETAGAADAHYVRADLDAHLAARAADAGANYFDRTTVNSVMSRGAGRGYELKGERAGAGEVSVAADFLIDAAGPGGGLRKFLNLPDETRRVRTRTAAVYAHRAGLEQWGDALAAAGHGSPDHPFPAGEAAVHHILPNGWVWELRFDDGLTSVGRVFPLGGKPAIDPADPFAVRGSPTLAARQAPATHAAPAGGPVRTGRLQRRTGRIAGADYALLPAAAGFVDPLHSTGLAHTAAGVLRLCTVLDDWWGRPELPRELPRYAASVGRELDRIDGLVAPCYAALGDWERFQLAVLLYEAAATCGERRAADDELLIAEDAAFTTVTERFAAELTRSPVRELEASLRPALAPWDAVGLFEPNVNNMHVRTAAPAEP